MQRFDTLRWVGAVGVTLAPLSIFIIPAFIYSGSGETPEEQFRGMADGSTDGYPGLVLQICGAVFLMAAALGIGGFTIARGRGRTLGSIGLITGMLTGVSLLVALGFETAVYGVLVASTLDEDSAVALAGELFASSAYLLPLAVGLGGLVVTLVMLAFALWRSRVVPIVVPLLFALPLLGNFVPLPVSVSALVASALLLAPCVWMSVQVIRGMPRDAATTTTTTTTTTETVSTSENRDAVDS